MAHNISFRMADCRAKRNSNVRQLKMDHLKEPMAQGIISWEYKKNENAESKNESGLRDPGGYLVS
jgi:hypothetical protein